MRRAFLLGAQAIRCWRLWLLLPSQELQTVFELVKDLKRRLNSAEPDELLKDKTLFTVFYASSTRIRNSFEAAMTQLGGMRIS